MEIQESGSAIARRFDDLEARLRRVEDVQQIQRLKALYCQYCDGGWEQQGPSHMGPIADLFVDDGIWDGGSALPLLKGREAIRKYFAECRVVPFATHQVMNPLIDVDGDDATGHWHVIGCFTLPGNEPRWILGIYRESYVRTTKGWRFKSISADVARTWTEPSGWEGSASVLNPTN